MSMYVIRVKPGMDCEVAASLRKRGYFIRCPQRTLSIRKDGTWTDRTEPIFSGYLFLESPETLRSESYYDICQADGVLYFLKQGADQLLCPAGKKYIFAYSGTRASRFLPLVSL